MRSFLNQPELKIFFYKLNFKENFSLIYIMNKFKEFIEIVQEPSTKKLLKEIENLNFEKILSSNEILKNLLLSKTKRAFFYLATDLETGLSELDNFENSINLQKINKVIEIKLRKNYLSYDLLLVILYFL